MDVDALVRAIDGGAVPRFAFFWGHTRPADERLNSACLSQWWPCRFEVDGHVYASAEHWMMAEKARLFGDHDARADVLSARTPGEAKKIGRRVRGFDGAVWERERFEIVVGGNVHKFGQNEAERAFLLGTGDRVLVEASPRDRIWGIGLDVRSPEALDPRKWRGLNLLGFALMEARSRLKSA